MKASHLVAALLLAWASPSQALFNPGSLGLPTDPNRPVINGDGGIYEPPVPPKPPTPAAIVVVQMGNDFLDVLVRPPAGRTSQLLKQPPGGSFALLQDLAPGVETTIHDDHLGVGKEYCYRLVVTGGAQSDEMHTTCASTRWRIGFEQPRITPEEGARVLSLFDWRDTQELAEGTDVPALYYMNLLVEPDDVDPRLLKEGPVQPGPIRMGGTPVASIGDVPQATDVDPSAPAPPAALLHTLSPRDAWNAALEGYRRMGLHVQEKPLFPEELDGWQDGQALATENGRPIGRWTFAVVSGSAFNRMRSFVLDQIAHGKQPGVRALVFRRIPNTAGRADSDPSWLSYRYLGEQGFDYNAYSQCRHNSDGTTTCEQPLLGWVLHKLVGWAAELGEEVVEAAREVIGKIESLIKGEITLDLQFKLLNTDPAFGTSEVMHSGWSGADLQLSHMKIEIHQGLAEFTGETDESGHVSITVAKNAETNVCIAVENDVAMLTEFVTEETICVRNLGELSGDTTTAIEARDDYLNALAGMTDAARYMKDVVGYEMPKITVLVGGMADTIALFGRSFTPCMGRVPSAMLEGPKDLLAGIPDFFTAVDMVLRKEDDSSRGVPVHEYGHAIMCQMLLDRGYPTFDLAWTDIIVATSHQSAGNEATYINEAFADFIAAQVVGGTNYFPTADSRLATGKEMSYCNAATTDTSPHCLEKNYTAGDLTGGLSSDAGQAAFQAQVRRVASILQDAFDGHLGPNDASAWDTYSTPFVSNVADDSDAQDEAIELDGPDLVHLFEYWDERGTFVDEDNFLGGLADLLTARGYSEQQVCGLFALHDTNQRCPDFVARRPWLGWLDGSGRITAFAAAAVSGGAPTRPVAVLDAIANATADAGDPAKPDSGGEPPALCDDCAPTTVLEGQQRISVAGLGKRTADTAFAFKLGDGTFEAIDPLGHLYVGGWDARNAVGSKLRLHLGPDANPALARLLGESLGDVGGSAPTPTGPARIELRRTARGVVGKLVIPFEVTVDGKVHRGSYVAKLTGARPSAS